MLTMEQIADFEKSYKKSMDMVLYWEQEMAKQQPHDVWMQIIRNRSQAMHDIYSENQTQFTRLFDGLNGELDDEIQECLYQMLLRLFYANGYDDAILMSRIAEKLLPYYEAKNDDSHILNLLHVQVFISTEYFYRQDCHSKNHSLYTYHGRIYAYRMRYKELPLEERRIILANYHNIICTLPMLLPHELNEILDIYDDYLTRMLDIEVIKMDSEDEILAMRRNAVENGVWYAAIIIENFDRAHLLHFYELLKKEYDKRTADDCGNIPYNIRSAYIYTSAYITENHILDTGITWSKAYDHLLPIAQILLEKLENMQLETINEAFLGSVCYPYIETACIIFKIYPHIKEEGGDLIMRDFIRRGTAIFNKFPKGEYTWMMYGNYTEWCEYALGALNSPDEQEELINSIIVKGQIQTYIHSQMVSLLANAILAQMIQFHPGLLSGMPGCETAASVQRNRKNLHAYVRHAALYHDIGKNRISAVINQQTRKLSDEEFALIRQHPKNPKGGVLKETSAFEQYYAVIEGHHKSYDGKTGYPAEFDNVHCRCRIIIDLITICDCLDAATDRLGRNYAGGKKFDEVLEELKAGSGTKYNPDIIRLISESGPLKKELRDIVNEGRNEVYYQTYQEYFS